jgi:hypothetical protein
MTLTKRRSLRTTSVVTRRRFAGLRTAVATVAVAGALFGCSSDKSTGPGSVTGTYHVVSITGPQGADNTSPFVIINETIEGSTFRAEMPSGTFTLGSDHRYTGTGVINVYIDNVFQPDFSGESFPSAGTYAVNGSTVTFTPDDASETPTTATFSSGNTLTFSETDTDPSSGATVTITIVAKK